ncbi:hypothetical protein ACFL35_10645 [Candidatus Riflebacteria bacterium]
MSNLRILSENFTKNLVKGIFSPILKRVKLDNDLDLQIREGYINIYFKGNSLLKLKENGAIDIHKKFKKNIPDFPTYLKNATECNNFVKNLLPKIKENIITTKASKDTLEIEYEQLLIRANNYTEKVNAEYYIVDRQFAEKGQKRKNQMDLTGIFSNRNKRRASTLTVTPFIGEVKYSLNKDISDIDAQIKKYYEQIVNNSALFFEQLEYLLHQKSKLGLFNVSDGLLKKFKTAKVDDRIENLKIVIILIDYNPNSKLFNQKVKRNIFQLPFKKNILVFNAGFAMWEQNLKNISKFVE